jgi:hypothetical protein
LNARFDLPDEEDDDIVWLRDPDTESRARRAD